jgi:3-hydroxyacyl-CoA dehydrogenase
MNDLVCFEVRQGVALVTIRNPPVNALSRGVLEGIIAAIRRAQDDPSVKAVVLAGDGRTFPAGADIHELRLAAAGQGPTPALHSALDAVEACVKPVVMAIHGSALGGGLELAMAGHYRIAAADAQVGQPEVKLGLIPGAGGTQRLPRLAGLAKAAVMCAFGEPLGAREALEAGILDRVVERDLIEEAIAFALAAPAPRRTRDLPVKGRVEDVAAVRGRIPRGMIAPAAALGAVQAATLPFDAGIRVEADLFDRCLHSDQCRGLIHAFFAERAAGKVAGVGADTPVYTVRRAAVIGAGTMGGGIAMALANAEIPVRLKDADAAALERGLAGIRRNYERSVRSGRLKPEAVDQRLALITPQLGYEGVEDCDLVIEAVFESLELKKRVFAELARVTRPDCLLASNTSTLDIDQLAAAAGRPEMVLGLHFFAPAHVMRLLEIVRGARTGAPALATALALARRLKKVAVVVGNSFGFAGNGTFLPYLDQAQLLVEEGAAPEQVDRALTDFGMAMGPLAVMDLSGLDVFWLIEQARPPGEGRPTALAKLYAAGRYGQKTGAGWYRYGDDRKPVPDPDAAALVQRERRPFSDAEIVERCFRAVFQEGRRLVEAGVAARASDIDVVWLAGFGFPNYRGGPMFYGEQQAWR